MDRDYSDALNAVYTHGGGESVVNGSVLKCVNKSFRERYNECHELRIRSYGILCYFNINPADKSRRFTKDIIRSGNTELVIVCREMGWSYSYDSMYYALDNVHMMRALRSIGCYQGSETIVRLLCDKRDTMEQLQFCIDDGYVVLCEHILSGIENRASLQKLQLLISAIIQNPVNYNFSEIRHIYSRTQNIEMYLEITDMLEKIYPHIREGIGGFAYLN